MSFCVERAILEARELRLMDDYILPLEKEYSSWQTGKHLGFQRPMSSLWGTN
jgi:hypothetical protein